MINLNESSYNQQFTFHHSTIAQLHYTPGIWVNGKNYWLQTSMEKIMYEEGMTVSVKPEQIHSSIRINHIHVTNHTNHTKQVKVLSMHHHSRISQEHFTFVSPKDQVIFHLADKEVYLVNGKFDGQGLHEYTVQPYWNVFTEKIWDCQNKGNLKYQPMAKGAAASITSLKAEINPHETIKLTTWMIKGSNKRDVVKLNQTLFKNTLAFPFEK
jgi:GH15 family glucan-1,4-alpha-glucosidase